MNDDGPTVYDGAELTQDGARYWLTMDAWTIGEAAYLLHAINPAALNRWAALNGGTVAVWLPEQFEPVQALLRRAGESGALPFPAKPADVIEWAMSKKLRLPAPLIPAGAVVRRGQWVTEGPAAAPAEATTTGRRTHRLGRDLLAPAIDRACCAVPDPTDSASVMAELERLARLPEKDRPPPLSGVTSGGIQWRDGGGTKTLTRKALGDRLRRRTQAR